MSEDNFDAELRRMLLWFKSQLPPHDLGDWQIWAHPQSEPWLVEGDAHRTVVGRGGIRISGRATCSRCGRQFNIPSIGNAVTHSEERIAIVVEEMKAWVQNEADREGPCWGDVPLPDYNWIIATLDSPRVR